MAVTVQLWDYPLWRRYYGLQSIQCPIIT